MEDPGIDSGTSHMQSERSTIWASPPPAKQFSVEYPPILNSATRMIIFMNTVQLFITVNQVDICYFLKEQDWKKESRLKYWLSALWTYSMWKISQ